MTNANTAQNPTHVDDVVGYFNACSDTFGQLAALLKVIEKEMTGDSDLRKLAGLGHYMATDYENIADCWREEIKTNGVRAI